MALPTWFCPDYELAVEALSEATRRGHPVSDLFYAVLARREGCRVLTYNCRLASLLRKLGNGVIGGGPGADWGASSAETPTVVPGPAGAVETRDPLPSRTR